uniref:Aldose reductase n=1 Tax=Opuntia streptacantha TaxID=393608 RepID=A0A7C8YID9_OPUST
MALQLNGGVWCLYQSRANWGKSIKHQQERFVIKAVASSEDYAAAAATATAKRQPISEEKVKLGASDVEVTRVGIGAWSWGDTTYWNNFEWDDRKLKAAKAAFDTSLDCGINFFDTAEVYGSRLAFGAINSETLLGRFIKERKRKDPDADVVVATKFAALPWRLGRQSVVNALKDSLYRLGLSSVDLYQLHWPGIWGNEGYIDGLGDAVEQGLVKAVGVSNYSEKRMRDAYQQLQKRGIPLASNQVNYSLIYRLPEENGVKAACDELGVTLIAYSPIAQGALTGKYTPENPPSGPRGRIYTSEYLRELQPLVNRIKEIGQKYNKTSTQVALNWLIAQENVVPIPGAKNGEQAAEFAGALGWRLSKEEVEELRSMAKQIRPITGFPVEKL